MKKELTQGAKVAPVPCVSAADKLCELLNKALPAECRVKDSVDRWYFRTIGWTAAGLLFPPLLAVAAYCLTQAKREERKGDEL